MVLRSCVSFSNDQLVHAPPSPAAGLGGSAAGITEKVTPVVLGSVRITTNEKHYTV
jgi:hypothetical protein